MTLPPAAIISSPSSIKARIIGASQKRLRTRRNDQISLNVSMGPCYPSRCASGKANQYWFLYGSIPSGCSSGSSQYEAADASHERLSGSLPNQSFKYRAGVINPK